MYSSLNQSVMSMSSAPTQRSWNSPSQAGSDHGNRPQTDEEYVTAIETLMRTNLLLTQENELFAGFLQRYNPTVEIEVEEVVKPRRGKKKSTRHNAAHMVPIDQRVAMATRECDMLRTEISKTEKQGEKLLDSLDAIIEECEMRVEEVKKDAKELKKEVMAATQSKTGLISADRITRWMDERLRAKDAMIEQLKLKTQMLLLAIHKVKVTLREKETSMNEGGLTQIDFDQLKIENKQLFDKISERNQELLKLKMSSGHVLQILNAFKDKLNHLVQEDEWLKKEIAQRNEFMGKINGATDEVHAQIDEFSEMRQTLKGKIQATQVPDILEYVNQKAHMYELEKELKRYTRKIELAERTLINVRTATASQGATAQISRPGSEMRMSTKSSRSVVQYPS